MRGDRSRLIGRTAVLVAIAATGGTVTASALAHGSDDGATGATTTAAATSTTPTSTTPATTTPTTTTPTRASRVVRIAGRVVASDATSDRFVVRTGRRHRTTVLSTRVPAIGRQVVVAGSRLADGSVRATSVRVVPDDRRGGREDEPGDHRRDHGNEAGDDHGGHGNEAGDDRGARR
jgi:hypothetical protein